LSRIDRGKFGSLIASQMMDNVLAIYSNHGRLAALAPCAVYRGISVLQSALREQNRQLLDEIFYFLAAAHNQAAVRVIAESLQSENPRVRANAVEALESLATSQAARLITPLFDPAITTPELLAIGSETWDMQPPDTASVINQLLATHDEWLRTIM